MRLIFIAFTIFAASCSTTQPEKPRVEEPVPEKPDEARQEPIGHKSSLNYVKKLAEQVNCTINKKVFKEELGKIKKFDLDPTNSNGSEVLRSLLSKKCIIRTYRSKWPWSKAVATTWTNEKEPNIYLNTRRHPRSVPSMVNTVVHECLHKHGYSHGNNNPTGKENTVNFKAGKIAENYACQ